MKCPHFPAMSLHSTSKTKIGPHKDRRTRRHTYTECTYFQTGWEPLILLCVYLISDTIHALLASGELFLEVEHIIIHTITHIHKRMHICAHACKIPLRLVHLFTKKCEIQTENTYSIPTNEKNTWTSMYVCMHTGTHTDIQKSVTVKTA